MSPRAAARLAARGLETDYKYVRTDVARCRLGDSLNEATTNGRGRLGYLLRRRRRCRPWAARLRGLGVSCRSDRRRSDEREGAIDAALGSERCSTVAVPV